MRWLLYWTRVVDIKNKPRYGPGFINVLKWSEDMEWCKQWRKGIGYCWHGFDEDVEGHADDIFSGVTDGVTNDRGFVRVRAFAVLFEATRFDVLFGVVKGTAGIPHENSSGNSNNCSADKQTTDEFYAEE